MPFVLPLYLKMKSSTMKHHLMVDCDWTSSWWAGCLANDFSALFFHLFRNQANLPSVVYESNEILKN